MNRFILFVCCLWASFAVHAEPINLVREGPPAKLIELYTSQGCSSCPSADRWLNALTEQPGLWTHTVPVAFHVDYWNYLGWPDNLSDPKFSARQRAYRKAGAVSGVYTPGFIVDGKEWRGYFKANALPRNNKTDHGKLRLIGEEGRFTLMWLPKAPGQNYVGNLAVMGFDFDIDIRGGENRNRTLHYDFAVLHFDTVRLQFNEAENSWQAELRLPASLPKAARYGIASWVIPTNKTRPVQVLGGWADANDLTAGL